MNILIRNYKKGYNLAQAVSSISVIEKEKQFEQELDIKRKIIFEHDKLDNPFILTKQDNGNLCIEFIKEETQ